MRDNLEYEKQSVPLHRTRIQSLKRVESNDL